jgi:hypothetical protein
VDTRAILAKTAAPVNLISARTLVKLEIALILILRLITWNCALQSREQNLSQTKNTCRLLILLFMNLGNVISVINYLQDFTYKPKPLADDLSENPFEVIKKIEPNNLEKDALHKQIMKDDLICRDSLQYTIGEKRIYLHVKYIIKTFEELRQYGFTGVPIPPEQFRYNPIPHITQNLDVPSKARIFEYLFFPGILAGNYISSLLGLTSTPFTVFVLAYTALTWLASVRESQLLRDIQLQINLEGFSYKYPSYFSFPPTCIGQQLTRKIVFYDDNKNMNEMLKYIQKSEALIKRLLISKALAPWPDIHKRLSGFRFMLIFEKKPEEKILDDWMPAKSTLIFE